MTGSKTSTAANEIGSALASAKRILEKTWLAAFAVIALVFIVSYFKEDREKLARFLEADLRLLGAAFLFQTAYFASTVFTWRKALFYSTDKGVNFWEGLSQVLLINFGKYIPGKIWGMAARAARLKSLGYEIGQIARATYVDQVLILLCGVGLAFLAAAIVFGSPAYWLGLAMTTVAVILFNHGGKLTSWITSHIPGTDWLQGIVGIRLSFAHILTLTAGCVSVWLLLTATFIMVCTALTDIPLSTHNIAIFLLSLTTGYLAGFIAVFAPGGVGVREGVGAAILGTVIPLEEALFVMLLFRIWVVLAELSAGAVILLKYNSLGEPDNGNRDAP